MIKAYLKNITRKRVLFLLFSILATFFSTLYYYYADGYHDWKNYLISTSEFSSFGVPLEFYYYIQSTSQSIWFSFITFIATTNIFATDRVIHKKSGFSYMMKIRTGHKKYFKNELILNTLLTLGYISILQITLLVTIQILIGPFDFDSMKNIDFVNYTNIFSDSPSFSLSIYILFSIIGYTLYSNFLFTLGSFISNVYVYRGFGVIMSILLTVLPSMTFITLYKTFGHKIFLNLGSLLFLPNLLNPGIQLLDSHYMILNSPYINFFCSCIFICTISILIYFLGCKKEYLYD